MDQLVALKAFWDEAPYLDGFKSDYAALYCAIWDSVNRNRWADTEIEYDRIINKTKMGKRMYLAGRAWLFENSFITMTKGLNEYSKAKYNIVVQNCTSTVPSTAPQLLPPEHLNSTSTVPYLNKTIDSNTKDNSIAADGGQSKVLFDLKKNDKGVDVCQTLRSECTAYFKDHKGLYEDAMYAEFIEYWSVPNGKNIPRWYSEKSRKGGSWSLAQRLSTWSKNFKPKSDMGGAAKKLVNIPDRLKVERVR